MKKYLLFAAVILFTVFLAGCQPAKKVENISEELPEEISVESSVEVENFLETPEEELLEETLADLIAQKHEKPSSEVSVQISEEKEGFAYGLVGFAGEMGGGMWFAAKTEKGWELAFDGNGIIPCDAVYKYDFPVNMIPKCVDNDELIER